MGSEEGQELREGERRWAGSSSPPPKKIHGYSCHGEGGQAYQCNALQT